MFPRLLQFVWIEVYGAFDLLSELLRGLGGAAAATLEVWANQLSCCLRYEKLALARGGGVGRSPISLTFLFTFKSAIRGVKPWSVSSIGASYRCIWPRRQDLVSIAVNREAKHTPQVDALQPGGRNLPDQFRWNDLAAVRPAIQDPPASVVFHAITMLAIRLNASATACISSTRLAWRRADPAGINGALEGVNSLARLSTRATRS